MRKKWTTRMISGILSAIMMLSAAAPATALASELTPEEELKIYVESLPELEQVKEQLDADEIVTAKDYEVEFGSDIDLKKDFTSLEIPDQEKVKVNFFEAKNAEKENFSTSRADTYKAVYYAVPANTEHPAYRFSRNVTVKEPVTEAQTESQGSEDAADGSGGGEEEVSSEDADADLEAELQAVTEATGLEAASSTPAAAAEESQILYEFTEEAYAEEMTAAGLMNAEETDAASDNAAAFEPETAFQPDSAPEAADEGQTEAAATESVTPAEETPAAETTDASTEETQAESESEPTDPAEETGSSAPEEEMIELTTEELDALAEEAESQDMFDEESGWTVSGIIAWATEEEEIDFAGLGVGQTVSFTVPRKAKALAASSVQTVDITRGSAYHYSDYGLGSYVTYPYTVQFGSVKATAYCVQPSRSSPGDGTFTITKLKDGKALAKVCYYGTKASGDEGFFAEKHPDFSAGKRFIITHMAAAYANGSSDAFSGTNDTGKSLAMALYNYCQDMPNIPDVDMEFSDDNVQAYVEGSVQRTKEITFKADELQTITFKLPAGVKLHNVSTGKTSKAGAEVEISGGTKFYFTAPMTQASDVGVTWSSKMKGSVTKDYSAYKITTGSSTQDLALVFGEAVAKDEKYVEMTVTWVQKAEIMIAKKDNADSTPLAGAVFGIYADEACTKLIAQMPATGSDGTAKAEIDVTQPTVYLKEITAPRGYVYQATAKGVNVVAGKTSQVTVENKEIMGELRIYKEGEVLTGADVSENGATFKYEKRRLSGASYQVTAGADIVSASGRVIYKKGAVVAEKLTTDSNGSAVLNNLHLGTYTVTETGAPKNFVTKGESKNITLSLANLSGEIVLGDVTIRNDRQKAEVTVTKQDDITKNPLSGGIYGIYVGADIKSVDGKVIVKKDTFIEKVTTGADGKATFKSDLPINNSYYVKELQAPKNYYRNEKDIYSFTFSYTNEKQAGVAFTHTFENERVDARIDLVKVDAETGEVTQGDAKFTKAIYGLYAREDIVHPDGKTGVLYKKNAQVATLETDENGKAHVTDLYLGKYFIKELVPSEGYLLDEKEYDLDCAYEGDLVKTVMKSATSKEQVIKQPFQVIKAANNGKTDADLLKGVGFSAYLISSLTTKKDGSYDFSKAAPIVLTADGKTEMVTDEKGYAVSIPIPYGKYIVRETTTPHNYTPVDDFEVTITENHPKEPQQWRVLLDDEFEAKLKIVKKDDETKKSVLLANTEFKVYDLDNKKYVEQVTTYLSTKTHTSYFTDENGYLILPNNLKIGHYRIEEVTAPYGYVLNHNAYEVLVDTNTAYQMEDTSGDAIIEVTVENQPVKGKLTITKAGEVLSSYHKDFGYEETSLAEAEFAVYAAEDIYTPDYQRDEKEDRIVIYQKDTLVTTVTTADDGSAVVKDLPLGSYRIEETKAPYGFVLNTTPQTVTFTYQDQETPVIEQTASFINDRQKVSLIVEKEDKETGKKLAGAVFGLYNVSAIATWDHTKVLMEADTLLQEVTTGEDGSAAFTLDLSLGQYYVRELKAPAGYVSSDEILTYDASYQGQDVPVVKLTAVKKNEPTTFEFTKSDITTGNEIEGAVLTILTRKGDVIERWTSVKNEPHVVKCLNPGESYVLREELAPYGYLRATDVVFTVEDTAEIQKVEMKDEVPTALLIINKKGEFLDKVSLLDNAKGTVEHLFEYISGDLTPVTFEVFAAEDIKAADDTQPDYFKKDDLVGTITTDDIGIAKLGDLPVGKYYVVEKDTAYGYVLDNEPRYVDLSYRDQDTPIVVYDEKWQNARQKVSVQLLKTEKGTETPLKGAIFGLYTAEDIKSKEGKVLIEKDTLIEQKTTDVDGKISFIADLPVDGKYYLTELFAPNGYVNAKEKQEFTFTYEGSDKDLLTYSFTFVNEPTTVELSKTDITTGKELPGAHLRVIDENAVLIDEWVSTETPHIIQKLVVGREYELIETKPVDGYVTAESVTFKVENTGEVQKVKMEDDVTKVYLSKTDITTGEEIPGAKLTILDKDGKIVETWISTTEPHYIEKLPIGDYTLREETAPAGYIVAEDVLFTVKDTGVEQKAEMKDDYTKVQISKQDITNGSEIPGAKLTIFDKDGKEVESWTSEEKPHYIERLPVGEYTLREETAPDGYLVAEDVKFTVEPAGEIQTVVMKDDHTKVQISKQDITSGKELPGAKLTIFDKDGKEVESWVSEETPHYIERLPIGEYTLREVTAPDGYDVAEDVKFTVEATGEIQTVIMKDAPKKQPETPTTETPSNPTNPTNPSTPTTETAKETPTTPKTGDDRNPLLWILLLAMAGSMGGAAWYLRKKEKNDQNQD